MMTKITLSREDGSLRALSIIALLGMLLASETGAVPPPSGIAPVVSPPGGLAIDGNLMANDPLADVGDWLPGTNSGAGGSVLDASGQSLNSSSTFHFVDPFNSTADLIFSGGMKWTDNPNTWTWSSGKPSSKTDINNVLLHIATDADGHTWAIVSADRASTSGDSYIDFEFLQNTLVRSNNGNFVSAGPDGGRTANDVLLSLAFTGGGKVADFFAYRWLSNGVTSFAYADSTASIPLGRVFAAANSNNIPVPYGAFGITTYAPAAFAEAAIDLSALLNAFDPCLSIGVKTIMVKTKASSSSTASIEDFIDPIQSKIQIGPSANAGPDQTRCYEGDTTTFPLQGIATRGLQPIVSTNWSVVSGTATIDDPTSLITVAHLASGTATLRLTVVQANGCTQSDDIVLTVTPLPTSTISGPSVVCPRSSNQFRGPAGMAGYAWSITGNGIISGATNAANVTVLAGSSCGANFTLTLNVTSNKCVNGATWDVTVVDTVPPVVTPPADRVMECPADTRTNVTGVASAVDDCGQVSVSYSDTVATVCGAARIISRTWTATDLCGNTDSKVQTITVQDTTKPSITAPPPVVPGVPGRHRDQQHRRGHSQRPLRVGYDQLQRQREQQLRRHQGDLPPLDGEG